MISLQNKNDQMNGMGGFNYGNDVTGNSVQSNSGKQNHLILSQTILNNNNNTNNNQKVYTHQSIQCDQNNLTEHQLTQKANEQKHLLQTSKSHLRELLQFHQYTKPKKKPNIFQQLTTETNFNPRYPNNSTQSIAKQNNNKSFIFSNKQHHKLHHTKTIQQQQIKKQLSKQLIKSYHKHESKYFSQLQKYVISLFEFEDKLHDQPFNVSLINNSVDQIKDNIQSYLENTICLENLVTQDIPNAEWTQERLIGFFSNYQPVYLPKQTLNTLTQKLTLKKYKNCVYFGHMINGKKQGQGLIFYFSGKLFQGQFKDDQKIFGFQFQFNQEEIYIGHFEKGLRQGIGMIKNSECFLWGNFNKGQFVRNDKQQIQKHQKSSSKQQQVLGKKDFVTRNNFHHNPNKNIKNELSSIETQKNNKQGFKLTFNSIIVYQSEFMIVKTLTNDIFIGNFNEQTEQKHGEGVEIFQNGDLYVGNYESNTPEMYGQYYWASGAFYRGQFLSGMRHGVGKWQMLHGDSYEGEYMNDKKNGQGRYLWKNGSIYIGAFQNDYRHGYGEMKWNDGRVYKGQWVNGIQKNVTIQLQNGMNNNNKVPKNKNIFNTIATIPQQQKRTVQSRRYNIPLSAAKRQNLTANQRNKLPSISIQRQNFTIITKGHQSRSVSNPNTNTRNSFQTSIDSSFPIRKKINLQNIKALYNPSNH